MILSTLLLLASAQGTTGEAAPKMTAVKVISNMLAHYHQLQSLTGTINLQVEAKASTGSVTQGIQTELQFEKPGKLYLRQVKLGSQPSEWLITSDGETFSYNVPKGLPYSKSKRLVENVNGKSIPEIYAASVLSVGDRSAPLGIAMNWNDELRRIVAEWPVCQLMGEVNWQGSKVWKISGKFKDRPDGDQIGDFVLVIDHDGNLLEYQTVQSIATPDAVGHLDAKHPIRLSQTWLVNLQPNGKPAEALFNVVIHQSGNSTQ